MKRVWFVVALAGLITSGCKKDKATSDEDLQPAKVVREGEPPAVPHGGPGAVHGAPHGAQGGNTTAPAQGGIKGPVLETMNSGGYTYVRVQNNGKDVWAAGPETVVKVGDQVSFAPEMPMENFPSPTLKRTFPLIYFVSSLGAVSGDGTAAAMPVPEAAASPDGGVKAEAIVDIPKAEGGKRVAEVFAEKATLSGKEVIIRGKVTKFNAGIMGRNWIHIEDGSGVKGSNDLTVTTDEMTEVGSIIVITGTVATDKDFGAGYAYGVIVENAKLSK